MSFTRKINWLKINCFLTNINYNEWEFIMEHLYERNGFL